MTASILLSAAVCILMICSVLFFPKIRIGKWKTDSYWVITLLGATVFLISGLTDVSELWSSLIADTAINPLKILILFLSMTILSIFLDELGFFRFLAGITLKKARTKQTKLFLYLYLTVSVLTVFTSNDVIILSFTPFICYFAKNAKINPLPYLAAEFVAANTWSMALIIGNPTNIYLASACGIDFVSYLKISILPTVLAGTVAFVVLYLIFKKQLSAPIEAEAEIVPIKDKPLLWVGIIHLAVCTVLLAVSSYVNLDMWLVSLCAVVSLFFIAAIFSMTRRKRPQELVGCLKRAPYQLIPFVLSMFVMISALDGRGATAALGNLLGSSNLIIKYGVGSFLFSNLVNNIPMSVLFSSVLSFAQYDSGAVFATIIGSNLGAILTPIGALAGIMWSNILGGHGVKYSYLDFLKTGVAISIPALLAALGGLYIAITFFI